MGPEKGGEAGGEEGIEAAAGMCGADGETVVSRW